MAIRKSVTELQVEASRRHLERAEQAREERNREWGGLLRMPPKMVTVRPGISDLTGERRRRCLDGSGGFITGVETIPTNEWIQRRIMDGDLEELTSEEAATAIKEEEEAAAAAAAAEEAANQPPTEEPPPPPPEGTEQPPPPPAQPPTEAQAQPVPMPEQPQPAAPPVPPAASFRQRRAAHG